MVILLSFLVLVTASGHYELWFYGEDLYKDSLFMFQRKRKKNSIWLWNNMKICNMRSVTYLYYCYISLYFFFQVRHFKWVVNPKIKILPYLLQQHPIASLYLFHSLSHTVCPTLCSHFFFLNLVFFSQTHSVSVVMVTVFSSLIMFRVCPIKWCRHRGPLNLPDIWKKKREQETQHLHDKWFLLITRAHTCWQMPPHTQLWMWHIEPDQRWHNEICMSRGLSVFRSVLWRLLRQVESLHTWIWDVCLRSSILQISNV